MLASLKTVINEAYEGSLRLLLTTLINRKHVYMYVPEVDGQALVQDRIISELDATIKFFEHKKFEIFKEKARKNTKVDYTWLISVPYRQYRMPPLERMEIETLAYKVKSEHVGLCIKQFKSLINSSTKVSDIPSLMRETLRKLLGDYELQNYRAEISRGSIFKRIRSEQKIYPCKETMEFKDTGVISNISSTNSTMQLT